MSQAPGRQRRIVVSYGSQWEERLKALWDDLAWSVNAMARALGVDPCTVKRHAQRLGLSLTRSTPRGSVMLKLTRPLWDPNGGQHVTRMAEGRQCYRQA